MMFKDQTDALRKRTIQHCYDGLPLGAAVGICVGRDEGLEDG